MNTRDRLSRLRMLSLMKKHPDYARAIGASGTLAARTAPASVPQLASKQSK